jgi:glycosyltransferase involved in cell wall biosynthesis
MWLTIAIPTYNRSDKLLCTVETLVPQIKDNKEIEILILDNCSDVELSVELKKRYPNETCIRVHREKVNIGMAANFANAFKLSNGKWMWLLGDDDRVADDAVKKILAELQCHPEYGVMNFGGATAVPPINERTVLRSLKDLCETFHDSWRLGTLFFMSNNVYNLNYVGMYLSKIYDWGYSTVPHAVPLLVCASEGIEILVTPDTIAEYVPGVGEQHWNIYRYRMGIPTIGEIPGCEVFLEQVIPSVFRQHHIFPNYLKAIPGCIIKGKRPLIFWRHYCFRLAASTKGFKSLYFLLCGTVLITFLKLTKLNILLKKHMSPINDLEGMSRL